MADGLRRVPVEAEVAAFDGEIGGNGQFFAWLEAEERAVVADPELDSGSGGRNRSGAGTNGLQQSQFAARLCRLARLQDGFGKLHSF